MALVSGLEAGPLAPLCNRLGAAVFRYGEHFYNFRGLLAYKDKCEPVWESRYLMTPVGLAFPRILSHLARLVSGGVRGGAGALSAPVGPSCERGWNAGLVTPDPEPRER